MISYDNDAEICDNCGGDHSFAACTECRACGGGKFNGHEPFCDVLAMAVNKGNRDKVRYLLNTYDLWRADGKFTFPDGETWSKVAE